ncbi:hypothetical protein [Endozoicomonas arenosclerae]|uniref:hypothetical protein n=1 Tax=Endozoicomonas arenosclerae TaxID=1633495 RepID=UPI00129463D1|nr:hypothetical protein [Endozoicomonas arenosclerae]
MKIRYLLLSFIFSLTAYSDNSVDISHIEEIAAGKSIKDYPIFDDPIELVFLEKKESFFDWLLSVTLKRSTFEVMAKAYKNEYTEYVSKYIDNKEYIDFYLESTTSLRGIKKDPEKETVHIKAMISGGDLRPYSLAVARNHAAFARMRNIRYDFVPFQSSEEYPVTQWLLEKLGDKKRYWGKVFLIQYWLENNFVEENKWVAWIDDDIVINDFTAVEHKLDWAVKYVPEESCIITTQDFWSIEEGEQMLFATFRANTGIILVRNHSECRPIIEQWLSFAKDERMGKQDQSKTVHEQEALERLADSYRLHREEDGFYMPMNIRHTFVRDPETEEWEIDTRTVRIVTLTNRYHVVQENRSLRDIDKNINTFKRHPFNWSGRHHPFSSDISAKLAALPGDSYVHHSGMPLLYRTILITHSLKEVIYPDD